MKRAGSISDDANLPALYFVPRRPAERFEIPGRQLPRKNFIRHVPRHEKCVASSLDSKTNIGNFAERAESATESRHQLKVEVRRPQIASPFSRNVIPLRAAILQPDPFALRILVLLFGILIVRHFFRLPGLQNFPRSNSLIP